MKQSNFQSMIFAIIFMTMIGHTHILFENTFNDIQANGKGDINTLNITTLKKSVYFDMYSFIS